MRLLDQVAQCCLPTLVEHDDGARFELTGAGAFSRDVIECPKRYVLDDRASRLTRDFLHASLALFSPQDRFVRLSAPSLWLEWWEPPADASTGGRPIRVGVLCRSGATGRRGRVRSFWAKDEHVSSAPGDIVFDLDAEPCWGGERQVGLHHSTHWEIQPLLRQACFEVDPDWFDYYSQSEAWLAALTQSAEICWIDFPFALAFGMLLSMRRGPLVPSASNHAKLNSARTLRGKRELLEHMEVRLALDGEIGDHFGDGAPRAAARLHQVRGHPVRRGEQMFWRRAHLRGVGGLLRQTTSVTASRGLSAAGGLRGRE